MVPAFSVGALGGPFSWGQEYKCAVQRAGFGLSGQAKQPVPMCNARDRAVTHLSYAGLNLYPPLGGREDMFPSTPTQETDLSSLAPSSFCSGHKEDLDTLCFPQLHRPPLLPSTPRKFSRKTGEGGQPAPGPSPWPQPSTCMGSGPELPNLAECLRAQV